MLFTKIRWWLFVVWLSSKWISKTNLGDEVVFNGKKYLVSNGVCDGFWSLYVEGDRTGESYIKHAKRSECKRVRTLKNYVGSFRSGYRFYMSYWYDIWVRVGIEEWMRGCNIWNKSSGAKD